MEHAHVCACTYIEGLLVACMKAAMPTASPYTCMLLRLVLLLHYINHTMYNVFIR